MKIFNTKKNTKIQQQQKEQQQQKSKKHALLCQLFTL